jgi:alpha-ketoglutarate-dependent taurine dioxygenase
MYSLQQQRIFSSSEGRTLQVMPLRPFGAQILSLDLSEARAGDSIPELRKLLAVHKMLLIRNQCLSPIAQIRLTHVFGSELHVAGPSLRYLPDYPQVFRISNRPGVGNPNTGQYWHSDGHYLSDPSAVTVMHIVSATPDGATLIADAAAAYRRLPTQAREMLSRHGFVNAETGVGHQIIRRHPLTGEIALYVNLHASPVDASFKHVPHLSSLIDQHLSQEGTFYEHRWREGDTIILDNFATAHRGVPSDPRNLRVLHRTTVTGPSVWWRIRSAEEKQIANTV